MRDFYDAAKRGEAESQRLDRLVSLIKQMAKGAKCPLGALSDADVRNVLLLRLQDPLAGVYSEGEIR